MTDLPRDYAGDDLVLLYTRKDRGMLTFGDIIFNLKIMFQLGYVYPDKFHSH